MSIQRHDTKGKPSFIRQLDALEQREKRSRTWIITLVSILFLFVFFWMFRDTIQESTDTTLPVDEVVQPSVKKGIIESDISTHLMDTMNTLDDTVKSTSSSPISTPIPTADQPRKQGNGITFEATPK